MTAGSVVITEEVYGTIKKIKFDWTSGDGAEDGTASGQTTHAYSGKILGLATVPAGAPDVPTSYGITVTDEDSLDVLMAAGAGRSATATEYVLSISLGAVANDKLTVNISGAGTNKKGVAYLYIR